jgi:CHAD domain-containing protein
MASTSPPTVDPATRLLKERIQRTFRHLRSALAGKEEEIHQMRVAARRLRAALPLLARRPAGKRVRGAARVLRDMARAGGVSRDLDVGLGLFDERLQAGHAAAPELKTLRRALVRARNRSRHQMSDALLDLEIAGLRKDLATIQKRGGEPVFTVFVRLRKAARKASAELEAELDSLGSAFDAERLHGIRRQFRQLRYLAEVLDAVRGQDSGAATGLRGLQEVLGRLHDNHVLAAWLQDQATKAQARGRTPLAGAARRECFVFLETCRSLHGQFLRQAPATVIANALAAMIPSRFAA